MILVTGANGQLGKEIRQLAPLYPVLQFLFTDIDELDITNEQTVATIVKDNGIDCILNCAAYTAVDKAEQEPDTAFLVNTGAAGNLARVAAATNCLLIHVSTDYVFSGTACKPYTESDPTAPNGIYAKSKLAGEEAVRHHANRALIIRTSWLYSEFGHNFVKTIIKYGQERGMLKVVADQTGTPTYAGDLARAILTIIAENKDLHGVSLYHYSNEGVASWYDFAMAIIELTGIQCRVHPITTAEYPLPAPRPWYSVLDKSAIKKRFGIEIPYWRESVKYCLERISGTQADPS